jgi:hypothetical protein
VIVCKLEGTGGFAQAKYWDLQKCMKMRGTVDDDEDGDDRTITQGLEERSGIGTAVSRLIRKLSQLLVAGRTEEADGFATRGGCWKRRWGLTKRGTE